MLSQYIPFEKKEFRPHQEEAIKSILGALDNDCPNIILNAPVGSGKSMIAYIVAKKMLEYEKSSYLYTSTILLQEQYLKDFEDLVTAKGRSNFECIESDAGFNCDVGVCKQKNNYRCAHGVSFDDELGICLKDEDDPCLYWEQKVNAIQAPISILNYKYLLTDNMFLNHFPVRDLGIYDEGHNLEKEIMGALQVELSDYQLKRDLNHSFRVCNNINDWGVELYTLSEEYRDLADTEENPIKQERYQTRAQTFSGASKRLDANPENWVFTMDEKFERWAGKKIKTVTFKPVETHMYMDLLFMSAQQHVIMSGSILKPDIFAEELALDDYEYIEIPSIVPAKRRPIYREYVGSMSARNFDNNYDNLCNKIYEIAERHSDEKGIIHTFTYKIAKRLEDAFGRDDRYVFHNSDNREIMTEYFLESDEPLILVSPYSYEGVDFPYDQGRWQIIAKNPYPYLGDAQVRARETLDGIKHDKDYGWCFRQIALVLSQMYGRTNRAIDDYSVTYLLDSDINRSFGNAALVTDYFLEGLVGYNYEKEFDLGTNAYDKTSVRSQRLKFLQTSILDAVQYEKLNTLEKLRKAYKALDGPSFKEVTPTVNSLISSGALVYK